MGFAVLARRVRKKSVCQTLQGTSLAGLVRPREEIILGKKPRFLLTPENPAAPSPQALHGSPREHPCPQHPPPRDGDLFKGACDLGGAIPFHHPSVPHPPVLRARPSPPAPTSPQPLGQVRLDEVMSGRTPCPRPQPRPAKGQMRRHPGPGVIPQEVLGRGQQQGHVGAVAWRAALQAPGVASPLLPGGSLWGASCSHSETPGLSRVPPPGTGQGGLETRAWDRAAGSPRGSPGTPLVSAPALTVPSARTLAQSHTPQNAVCLSGWPRLSAGGSLESRSSRQPTAWDLGLSRVTRRETWPLPLPCPSQTGPVPRFALDKNGSQSPREEMQGVDSKTSPLSARRTVCGGELSGGGCRGRGGRGGCSDFGGKY